MDQPCLTSKCAAAEDDANSDPGCCFPLDSGNGRTGSETETTTATDTTDEEDEMSESPVAVARTPVTPSGPLAARPAMHRTKSNSLSQRRPELRLQLTSDEQSSFNAAIEAARSHLVSDALKLPVSTNMGLGKDGPPAQVMKNGGGGEEDGGGASTAKPNTSTASAAASTAQQMPAVMRRAPATNAWPIPQPVADKERTQIPTEHERAIRAHDDHAHSWEESETFSGRAGTAAARLTESRRDKPIFVRAIPCMYVANVSNATTFYRDILGFSLLGKPDSSHASLFRSPSNGKPEAAKAMAGGANRSRNLAKQAPADSVQIYVRIAPMGPDGERVKPPATTLWILVNDVDAVYNEIQTKWLSFQPRTDEYFPMHTFGDAKILAKPQNKAWGNRELHIVDGDENKIIFFRELI